MLRNHMGMLQLDGHAGNVGKRETVFAGKDALAPMRHSLSQSRDNSSATSANSGVRNAGEEGKKCSLQEG